MISSIVTILLPLALQLIEMFISDQKENDQAKADAVALAASLAALGAKNVKSMFADELAQKTSIDDQWAQAEAGKDKKS